MHTQLNINRKPRSNAAMQHHHDSLTPLCIAVLTAPQIEEGMPQSARRNDEVALDPVLPFCLGELRVHATQMPGGEDDRLKSQAKSKIVVATREQIVEDLECHE